MHILYPLRYTTITKSAFLPEYLPRAL